MRFSVGVNFTSWADKRGLQEPSGKYPNQDVSFGTRTSSLSNWQGIKEHDSMKNLFGVEL